ncbi:hypothetical protein HY086_05450 [Candidatus Gottesmanbacteria bacterium]|nr:hypothetical protein [Candidatus Gottesmanbacteria bacterium]
MEIKEAETIFGSGTSGQDWDPQALTRDDAVAIALANGCHRPLTNIVANIEKEAGNTQRGLERDVKANLSHNILWQMVVAEVRSSLGEEHPLYVDITQGTEPVPENIYTESSEADRVVLPDSYTKEKKRKGLARDFAYAITSALLQRMNELKTPDSDINSLVFASMMARLDDIIKSPDEVPTSLDELSNRFLAIHDSIETRLADATIGIDQFRHISTEGDVAEKSDYHWRIINQMMSWWENN